MPGVQADSEGNITETEPEIAVNYPPEPLVGKQPVELQGTFKLMRQKGIRLTSYIQTDGSGRITEF
jgi:hypothetical protein